LAGKIRRVSYRFQYFSAAELLCAQGNAKFQIFIDDCIYCNRFSLMCTECTAEVSINIREAFKDLEY
jgi:hypothetical protein